MRRLFVGTVSCVSVLWAGVAWASVTPIPDNVTLFQGETSNAISVRVRHPPVAAFTTGILSVGGLPFDVTTSPAVPTFLATLDTNVSDTALRIVVGPSAPAGTYSITLTDASLGSGTAVVLLTVLARGEPSLTVNPVALTTHAGGASTVNVRLTFLAVRTLPVGAALGVLQVTGLPGGATTNPAVLTYPVRLYDTAASVSFQIVTTAATPPGQYLLTISDTTFGAGSATAVLTVLPVLRDPPTITALSPAAVPVGAPSVPVRIVGRGFDLGGRVDVSGRGVVVLGSRILSSTLAEVTLALRDDAPPGPREIRIGNTDGQVTRPAGRLVVLANSPLAGPLTVTRLVTLAPQPGAALGPDDRVQAQGLVIVTGAGTIVGSWLLDGVPFDRFTAYATGGDPVEVSSIVPVPALIGGEHRLELAIDLPQRLVSSPVTLIGVAESRTALRLLAPAHNALLLRTSPETFRWTLVPGASGYEIEISGTAGAETRRTRVTDSEWTPDARTWSQLADGRYEWRVRPVFLDEVRGEACRPRAFTLVPASVEIGGIVTGRDGATGRALLRWTGGPTGLVYRVELFEASAMRPVFVGLTRTTSFVFPPEARYGRQRSSVRITALGPRGLGLGTSPIVTTSVSDGAEAAGRFWPVALAAPPAVSAVGPPDGTTVTEPQPIIEALWTGVVERTEVALSVDDIDVTQAATWSPGAVVYPSAVPLAAGPHTVTLKLAGVTQGWSFNVASPEGETAVASGAPTPQNRQEWGLTAQGTVAQWDIPAGAASGAAAGATTLPPGNVARLQVGLQADLARAGYTLKATGDTAARYDLDDPRRTTDENRNWLVAGGTTHGDAREAAQVGYGTPSFSDQAEIVTTGLPRVGLEARVQRSLFSASGYHSFDAGGPGLAGVSMLDQTVRGASVQVGRDGGKATLRANLIGVETKPGELSAGNTGTLFGFLGRVALGSALTVVAEGAHGSSRAGFDPLAYPEEEGVPAVEPPEEKGGVSWRLNLSGTTPQITYTFNLRQSGRDFSNPASSGLTSGSTGNMLTADLMLNKMLSGGKVTLAFMGRHAESDAVAADDAPKINDDNVTLTVALGGGSRVSLMLAGTGMRRRGDAYEAYGMAQTDVRTWSGAATLTETVSTLTLSQMATYQRADDRIGEYGDATTSMGMLSANGSLGSHLTLSFTVSAMRNDAGPAFGSTDMLMASVQPVVQMQRFGLSLQPSLMYSKMKNALASTDTSTEQYGGSLSWTPRRLRSLATLQVLGDWSRMRGGGLAEGFVRRVAGVLTLRWTRGKGATLSPAMGATPAAPLTPAPGGLPTSGQTVSSLGPLGCVAGAGGLWPATPCGARGPVTHP